MTPPPSTEPSAEDARNQAFQAMLERHHPVTLGEAFDAGYDASTTRSQKRRVAASRLSAGAWASLMRGESTSPPSPEPAPVTDAEAEAWASPAQMLPNSYKRQAEMWKDRTRRLCASRARTQERIVELEEALRHWGGASHLDIRLGEISACPDCDKIRALLEVPDGEA